jgi:hypothetical protein
MPTDEQLAQVKENVANMMDFTNHVHPFFSDKVNDVYLNLKSDQNTDPGQKFICTLFDSVFWSISALEFVGATVFASFLGTFFGAYVGPDAPPNLEKTLASVLERLDATISQALEDLALIYDNPAAYWDKTYTNPLNNKTTSVSSLGDGTSSFPAQHTELFQAITNSTVFQFRQDLTKSVLPSVYYVYYSDYYSSWQYQTKEEFFQYASKYIAQYPAYFFKYRQVWKWRNGQRADVIQYYNFSLVVEGSVVSVASDDLCKWLFQDDGYGHQTNPDGVARRSDVFFGWGLREYYGDGKPFGIDSATFEALAAITPDQLILVDESNLGPGPKPLQGPPAEKG